jgi:hypothetical protein
MVTGNCELADWLAAAVPVPDAAGPVEHAVSVSAAAARTAVALPAVLSSTRRKGPAARPLRPAPKPEKRGEVTELLR